MGIPPARARIADVAREAGVSKASVSFAFNRPERLRPETAARIRDVAVRLGYRPDPVARMLTARRTATLGILTPQPLDQAFANPFFASFLQGIARAAGERSFGMRLISPVDGSLARGLGRASVDGIVAIGVDQRHPEVETVRRNGLPVVLVDAPAWPEHGSVSIDDEGGAAAAARHLLGLGHREILIISMEPPSLASDAGESVMTRRMVGYREALRSAGVDLADDAIVVAPATFDGGELAFRRAWDSGLRATGVLSMSDAAAIGAMQAARDVGLRVPDDLSVVGFDDLPFTRFTDPPLTTVHQPVVEKGEVAARLLLEAMAVADGRPGEHVALETTLVVRGSTALAPHAMRQEVVAAR